MIVDGRPAGVDVAQPITESRDVRVYIDERGVSVPAASSALDAVRSVNPDAADEIESGTMQLLDSRGLPTDATLPVTGGAIFRIVPVRRRGGVDSGTS